MKKHFYFFGDTKLATAHKHGLDLIIVPCWWDGSLGRYSEKERRNKAIRKRKKRYASIIILIIIILLSIASTISFSRPDLNLTSSVPAIPFNPPLHFFGGINNLLLFVLFFILLIINF